MKILLLDNFDSFTFNLYDYLCRLNTEVEVFRNDVAIDDVSENYTHIVLSPGPGLPSEAGILHQVIKKYMGQIPILGVCLGHQAIAEVLGGNLRNLENPFHGLQREIEVKNQNSLLFKDLENIQQVGLYHSWVVDQVPEGFEITAKLNDDIIMAMEHPALKLCGVQFHPESIMTPFGLKILENFIKNTSI